MRSFLLKKTANSLLLLCLPVALCAQQPGFEVLNSWHNEICIKSFTGNTLSVTYHSLPANQAGLNNNSIWVWAASQVPWRYVPEKKVPLPAGSGEAGSYVIEGVAVSTGTPYIACYSVDTLVTGICACSNLAAVSDSTFSSWLSMELVTVTANSLTFSYSTLPGYLPAAYGNWFGLWKGMASPYNPPRPVASGKVADDATDNSASLNNLSLESGQVYTLIYFTGADTTAAAAMIYFKVK